MFGCLKAMRTTRQRANVQTTERDGANEKWIMDGMCMWIGMAVNKGTIHLFGNRTESYSSNATTVQNVHSFSYHLHIYPMKYFHRSLTLSRNCFLYVLDWCMVFWLVVTFCKYHAKLRLKTESFVYFQRIFFDWKPKQHESWISYTLIENISWTNRKTKRKKKNIVLQP